MNQNIFRDADLLPELLGMVLWDRYWLRQAGDVVKADDFKPVPRVGGQGENTNFWIAANMGLEFFMKNRIPIGSLLNQEIAKWAKETNSSSQRVMEFRTFLKNIRKRYNPERSKVLVEQVVEFKKRVLRQRMLRELVELETSGQLTEEAWLEAMRKGVAVSSTNGKVTDWVSGMVGRQQRRLSRPHLRKPVMFIDDLDASIQSVGRGELGLWLGAYKMGKSMAMIGTGAAYLWQGLNVLYFTLEDPLVAVEDRFDASITELAIDELGRHAETESRFELFRSRLRSRIRLVDGTGGGMTVAQIQEIWERQRMSGFHADAIITDYDNHIRPPVSRKERRFEFSDIYREYVNMCGNLDIIGWLAAQAKRDADGKKIVAGKDTSEDISKIQQVTLAVGIGQGEWGDDSRYLYIAAHKYDRSRFGFNIWSDPSKGLFYDRQRTLEYRNHDGRPKAADTKGVMG